MKNIKRMKTKIILSLTVGLLLLYSCSDEYLQDEKRDGLSSDVVFASEETASAAIIGIYDVLQGSPAEYITKAIFYPATLILVQIPFFKLLKFPRYLPHLMRFGYKIMRV